MRFDRARDVREFGLGVEQAGIDRASGNANRVMVRWVSSRRYARDASGAQLADLVEQQQETIEAPFAQHDIGVETREPAGDLADRQPCPGETAPRMRERLGDRVARDLAVSLPLERIGADTRAQTAIEQRGAVAYALVPARFSRSAATVRP
jgi:hypothetical protein